MNIAEYFETLTHAERVRVQFYPPRSDNDCGHEELRALKSLQDQWQDLLAGRSRRALSAPEQDQVQAELDRFLGKRP